MGDVTDYYWSCDCKEDVIRGWFEDRCKRCGLGISEGGMVDEGGVISELSRDSRLRRGVRRYFEGMNKGGDV